MTAQGAVSANGEMAPNGGLKCLFYKAPSTFSNGDTFTIDLTANGGKVRTLHGVLGFDETTAGQVVVQVQPTTTVASTGVMTVTIGGSGGTIARMFLFFFD